MLGSFLNINLLSNWKSYVVVGHLCSEKDAMIYCFYIDLLIKGINFKLCCHHLSSDLLFPIFQPTISYINSWLQSDKPSLQAWSILFDFHSLYISTCQTWDWRVLQIFIYQKFNAFSVSSLKPTSSMHLSRPLALNAIPFAIIVSLLTG